MSEYIPLEKRRIKIKGGLVLITSYWERQVGGKVTKVSKEKNASLNILFSRRKIEILSRKCKPRNNFLLQTFPQIDDLKTEEKNQNFAVIHLLRFFCVRANVFKCVATTTLHKRDERGETHLEARTLFCRTLAMKI